MANISDSDWERAMGVKRDPAIVAMEARMNRAWALIDGLPQPCAICEAFGQCCCKLHRQAVGK